ncbi:MAG: hypothetical protein Q8904_08340 [Bacteroidota bacterium]|nr:hypothetical protein [Bacteroidota bacterium]
MDNDIKKRLTVSKSLEQYIVLSHFLKNTTKTAFLNKKIRVLVWGSQVLYGALISKNTDFKLRTLFLFFYPLVVPDKDAKSPNKSNFIKC